MGLRETWKFGYTAAAVGAAARRKLDFHRQREAFWLEKFETAFQEVKDSVEVLETPDTDNQAFTKASYSLRNDHMGTDLLIKADPIKQRHMENCKSKLKQHHNTADRYETYALVLEGQGEVMLDMQVDDVIFFGLVGWDPELETAQDG